MQNSTNFRTFTFASSVLAATVAIFAITLAFLSPIRNRIQYFCSQSFPKASFASPGQMGSIVDSGTNGSTNGTTKRLKITKRPWNERGHADHGWLYTYRKFGLSTDASSLTFDQIPSTLRPITRPIPTMSPSARFALSTKTAWRRAQDSDYTRTPSS